MARLRRQRLNELDPQFRLAKILHSSLGSLQPGQVPSRRRLSGIGPIGQLTDHYQSQPESHRRSLSPVYPYTSRNELVLTAL